MNENVVVIIPTHNSMSFIGEALGSINSVISRGSILSLLCDNKSTDGTIELGVNLNSNNGYINLISNRDAGPSQAINAGLNLINKANIIGWLNSDDVYASGAIDRAIKLFESNPKLRIVYGLGRHIDACGKDLGLSNSTTLCLH